MTRPATQPRWVLALPAGTPARGGATVDYDCAAFGHLTVADEHRCRACGAEAWLGCQVCEREDNDHAAVAVAASPLGPVSLAYCRECLAHRADALFLYEAVLEAGNWR